MPVCSSVLTRRVDQDRFRTLAYEVLGHAFAIHNDFGRFFDEMVYRNELASRLRRFEVLTEAWVEASHGTFSRRYYADLLVEHCALFELKTADNIHPRYVSQTINYLFLFHLSHGMVVNLRPARVESRFVNCHLRLEDLLHPKVDDREWDPYVSGADRFRDVLLALVADWGAGLQIELYESALIHLFGGDDVVCRETPVWGTDGIVGGKALRYVAPGVPFVLTGLSNGLESYRGHLVSLIRKTRLRFLHWANIQPRQLTLKTLRA